MVLVVSCFCLSEFFFSEVAMCDQVHNVNTMHGLFNLLTKSGYLFKNMIGVMLRKLQFAVSQTSLILQNRFPAKARIFFIFRFTDPPDPIF